MAVARYAVVGTYTSNHESKFVRHVALVREDTFTRYGMAVPVWEMQPPLIAGPVSASRAPRAPECEAHLLAWLSLTTDERDGITDWLAEVDKQDRPMTPLGFLNQYTVSLAPEDQWHHDERDVPLFRRFNCVSFVLAAYMDGAGINVLNNLGFVDLPAVGLDVVARAFGEEYVRRELSAQNWTYRHRAMANLDARLCFPCDGPD